ncbi:hypothetical protein CLOM_g22814 [Closterium sp. NIES-68]|nr:hypothetical protein CLOM_g22814 [Closterium sp. NIES-68]GJP72801.1 hypothetical protein CLOP_g3558 [Closterium sp. NIES-67]
MAVASLQWLPGAADASFMPRSTAVHRSTAGQLSLLSQCQSGFRRGLPWFRQRLLAGAGACGQREPQVAFGSSGSRRGRSGLAVHAAAADVTDISSTSPLPASLELAVQVAPLHASHPDSALVPLPLLSFPSQILDPAAFLPSPLSSGVAAPHAESVMTASLPAVAPPLPLQQAMASADVRAASAVAEAVVLGDAMGPPRSVEEAIRMAMRNAMEGSDDGDMATEEADDIMARARNPFRMRALDMQPAEPAPAAAPAPALTDARVDAGEKQAEPESGLQNALQNLLPPLNWPNQAAPPIDAPASPAFAPPALPVGPPLSDASAPPAPAGTASSDSEDLSDRFPTLFRLLRAPSSLLPWGDGGGGGAEGERWGVESVVEAGEEALELLGGELDLTFPAFRPGDALIALSGALRNFMRQPADDKLAQLAAGGALYLYLTARPGVLAGALDAYIGAPLQALTDTVRGRRQFRRSDFVVGRRLGEGNFGTVYEGALKKKGKASEEEEFGRRSRQLDDLDERDIKSRVILKKVKTRVMGGEQSGEMEEWFNRRMQRVAPEACARFMGSFTADVTRAQFTEGGKWLVWNYEGDRTLLDYIRERDFPDNVEEAIFGRGQMVLQGLDSVARRGVTVKQVLRQVLISLKKMHATGIVHRDVKPSNLVITNTGRVKLIDFGAAADLRIGMNYEPELALLDPDYAPPEQFVLPEETPSPPAAPIAAMLSPALWQFNHPDLFDTYSVGIIFLQMASPTLRTPAGLQTFKKELRAARYDLKRWRRETRMRPDLRVLDLEGGAGWDLATRLVCERGTLRKGRLSAAEALRHPYLLLGVDQAATAISKLTLSR